MMSHFNIPEKIQGLSLNVNDHVLFTRYWKNKHEKKNSNSKKRKVDSAWNDESPSKRRKIIE